MRRLVSLLEKGCRGRKRKSMTGEMWFWSGLSALLVLTPGALLFARTVAAASRRGRWSAADRVAGAVCGALLAVLFLRPHQHAFEALDPAAFRRMADAFARGRGFHDRDEALSELPAELRRWTLMHTAGFAAGERVTRDRAFQLDDLENPTTRPYFYPLLPLNLAFFRAARPGAAMDYFIPAFSLLFWTALLAHAGGRGGWRGILLAFALAVGSPLPAWLARGAHLEAMSATLLGLAALDWLAREPEESPSGAACFATGLAVSYHPIMILIALPLGLAMLCSCRGGRAARWPASRAWRPCSS